MPAITVDIHDLPSRWKDLIAMTESGNEIIVTEGNIPRARLVPLSTGQKRVPGLHPGAIQTTADFDAPLSDEFWNAAP